MRHPQAPHPCEERVGETTSRFGDILDRSVKQLRDDERCDGTDDRSPDHIGGIVQSHCNTRDHYEGCSGEQDHARPPGVHERREGDCHGGRRMVARERRIARGRDEEKMREPGVRIGRPRSSPEVADDLVRPERQGGRRER